jgi:hypothetical protein
MKLMNCDPLRIKYRGIVVYLQLMNSFEQNIHVKWVPCHHGMARSRVADRGDGLQIWRVAAIILNKQSQTADTS